MTRRVVITGLGVISPIGIGVRRFWDAALEGRSGVAAVREFEGLPLDAYRSRVAGQVQDFEQVELDVANVGDVVPHGDFLPADKLQKVSLNRENVRNRSLR